MSPVQGASPEEVAQIQVNLKKRGGAKKGLAKKGEEQTGPGKSSIGTQIDLMYGGGNSCLRYFLWGKLGNAIKRSKEKKFFKSMSFAVFKLRKAKGGGADQTSFELQSVNLKPSARQKVQEAIEQVKETNTPVVS